jgi:hypothetical protein
LSAEAPLIVIPVCNEQEAIGPVLDELIPVASALGLRVAVGLNGCTDSSRDTAMERGVLVGETPVRGYGHGCMAAIAAAREAGYAPVAYLFMAGDGAHDPQELPRLLNAWRSGADLVLGQRTFHPKNWPALGGVRLACNVVLGAFAGMLCGRWYADLGPFRLISRSLFDQIRPAEWGWGWTIEPQVAAPLLRQRVATVTVTERPRLAGQQKVTGVSLEHSFAIGLEIASAGFRVAKRLACRTSTT